MEATPGFFLHFLCWPCSSVWGTGLGLTCSPTSPPGRINPGLAAPPPLARIPPGSDPTQPGDSSSHRECCGIPAHALAPRTGPSSLCPAASCIPGAVPPFTRSCSTLHPLPFPARASRVHPAALEQAGQREGTLPCPAARSRSGLAAGPVPGPCGYLPPPFSAASVPNQSLIPARMKVSLLLLTNAIVFPMFSPAREQRLGPCRCQLC